MSSPLIPRGRGAYQAFTLIELLTVITIIGILAGITLSVMGGVKERAAISRAKGELSILAQALEAYKKQYGDYPHMTSASVSYTDNVNLTVGAASTAKQDDGPGILFNSLVGKLGPKGDAMKGKSLIEVARFTLQDPTKLPDSTAGQTENAFVDPWGHRYLYYYKTGAANIWKQPGYILLSAGPVVASDGNPGISVSTDGSYTEPASEKANAADNIYANR